MIFRLQHTKSGYGPYEHRLCNNRQSKIVNKLKYHLDPNKSNIFKDFCKINSYDENKLPENLRFAWCSISLLNNFIKQDTIISRYGFQILCLDVLPVLTLEDGQCLFDIYEVVNSYPAS